MAELSRIRRFSEKGKPAEELMEAELIEGLGLKGDRHADGSNRQLTLLRAETAEWMRTRETPGLCFRRYQANLEIRGLPEGSLMPDRKLTVGEAVVEITAEGKHCFPECGLFHSGEECRLSREGSCGRVMRGGRIRVGDFSQI